MSLTYTEIALKSPGRWLKAVALCIVSFMDSANERHENLFSNGRVQPILCKDSASESRTSSLLECYAERSLSYARIVQTRAEHQVYLNVMPSVAYLMQR